MFEANFKCMQMYHILECLGWSLCITHLESPSTLCKTLRNRAPQTCMLVDSVGHRNRDENVKTSKPKIIDPMIYGFILRFDVEGLGAGYFCSIQVGKNPANPNL